MKICLIGECAESHEENTPNCQCVWLKGIDRPFKLKGESRLIRSVITNWMLRKFFSSHFKGSSSQDQQKPWDAA
jgi:hypothetical protein